MTRSNVTLQPINFFYDRITNVGKGYPNLARHPAEPFTQAWRQFDHFWPRTVPLRLLMYFDHARIKYQLVDHNSKFEYAWYPIALGWFDFELDYFSLIPENTLNLIRQGKLKVLFYYHEGDNPQRIQQRILDLGHQYQINNTSIKFISANSTADWYFADHECFFWYLNKSQDCPEPTVGQQSYDFTLLNRVPKWWRAAIMTDLQDLGVLSTSLWSWNTSNQIIADSEEDIPIELDSKAGWRSKTKQFVNNTGTVYCDLLTERQHNDHHLVNISLYQESFCHLIIETHFDADQSRGTFLTEKTFKCLKYGQPFIMIGPPNSIATLRAMGYKTFDNVIDHDYDQELDNSKRWQMIRQEIVRIKNIPNKQQWLLECLQQLKYNQEMFRLRFDIALNNIIKELTCL